MTTNYVPGMKIGKTLGPAFGMVVRSRMRIGDIIAGLRSFVEGEIKEYTKMLTEARDRSVGRLVETASAVGANAMVDMRFGSSGIGQMMAEIVAYGTTVVVEKDGGNVAPVSLR